MCTWVQVNICNLFAAEGLRSVAPNSAGTAWGTTAKWQASARHQQALSLALQTEALRTPRALLSKAFWHERDPPQPLQMSKLNAL